jgi:predicted dehydrogenase
MNATVLLGLLGCGPRAEHIHLPAMRALSTVRLTAAYDPSVERRDAVARLAPGCRSVSSPEALFETRVVDAVIIAAPVAKRAALAVQSLGAGAGIPVLIDPPMAASVEEGLWIRDAEQIVRLPVMVGYNRRRWRPVEVVRRVLAADAPAVGQEPTIESTLLRTADPGTPPPDESGFDPRVLADLDVHLDLARHLMGRELATVSARRDPLEQIQVEATFHGGGTAAFRVGRAERSEERVLVRAGKRAFELRPGSDRARPSGGTARAVIDLADQTGRKLTSARDSLARSYERQLEAFVDAVSTRAKVAPGTTDGVAALLAVDAVRRSLAEGSVGIEVPLAPNT